MRDDEGAIDLAGFDFFLQRLRVSLHVRLSGFNGQPFVHHWAKRQLLSEWKKWGCEPVAHWMAYKALKVLNATQVSMFAVNQMWLIVGIFVLLTSLLEQGER
jgi:hypothetical protein